MATDGGYIPSAPAQLEVQHAQDDVYSVDIAKTANIPDGAGSILVQLASKVAEFF
ncbi:MAG: hypothetical protein LBP35_03455 [Candidatus Ancillula trichonymphae]|nr:hypothetical protein [Candidatus Ancillula trichonymphae]